MGENLEGLREFGSRWGGCANMVGALIALSVLVGAGTWFYDAVWKSKLLVYTVLPSYDLGDQYFSGLVVENRGRVSLTDVQIIISEMGSPIVAINMPGPHEPVTVVTGGEGQQDVFLQMTRLSVGSSLPVYLITAGEVDLEQGRTFLITSQEVAGVSAAVGEEVVSGSLVLLLTMVAAVATGLFMVWTVDRLAEAHTKRTYRS